jgi:hypothetical protein
MLVPIFERGANDGSYWLVDDSHGRLPVVFFGGANAATPAAVVIPLDADFAARADSAIRLWRVATGRPRGPPPDRLTRQRRHRLGLTRGDVLLRNKEVFRFWKTLGLSYIFLGIEAIDEDGLKKFRKRISLGRNFEALEFARSLGVMVTINIIADPDWDEQRFATVRQWCQEVPEIVNLSINTPYPGTKSWITEERSLQTRDYRLFDVQHAVLPTKLPLPVFYREL